MLKYLKRLGAKTPSLPSTITSTGRFINGDAVEFAVIEQSILSHNLFGYCENDCVNSIDPLGYSTIVISLLWILACFICASIVSLLCQLLSIINSYEFQSSWNSFCIAIGEGFSISWDTITKSYKKVKSWTKKQIKSFEKTLSEAIKIAKSVSKIITLVKTIRNAYIGFYEIYFFGDLPIIGKKINKNQAVTRARNGGNSITYFKRNALWVSNSAGNAKAIHHKPHGRIGYFSHYHISEHKNSAHIFYITI